MKDARGVSSSADHCMAVEDKNATLPKEPAQSASGPAGEAAQILPLEPRARNYALFILLLVYTVSLIDRQIVSILAEPIKNELKISDTQLGLLGLAFGLIYCVLGLPLALLADRVNRVWIISGSVAVWSLFTMACGRTTGYISLCIARVGVGLGESGATPTAHALIADYVPKEKRASALSFFATGAPLGSLIGLAFGGIIADALGWRSAFLIAGAPGLMLALVVFLTLKEPRNKLSAAALATVAKARLGLFSTLGYLARKRSFWLMGGGASLNTFIAYGQGAFGASFYVRVHGEELQRLAAPFHLQPLGFVGIVLGLLVGVMGGISSLLGGWQADRAAKTDLRGYCVAPTIANLLIFPLLLGVFFVPSVIVSFALLIPVYLLGYLWNGPVYSSAQGLVPPQMRATSASIILFVINILGLGFGALVVGAISDYCNKGLGMGPAEGVRWALVITSGVGLIAAGMYWSARRWIAQEMVS